jgi:hypothetical protein
LRLRKSMWRRTALSASFQRGRKSDATTYSCRSELLTFDQLRLNTLGL